MMIFPLATDKCEDGPENTKIKIVEDSVGWRSYNLIEIPKDVVTQSTHLRLGSTVLSFCDVDLN